MLVEEIGLADAKEVAGCRSIVSTANKTPDMGAPKPAATPAPAPAAIMSMWERCRNHLFTVARHPHMEKLIINCVF